MAVPQELINAVIEEIPLSTSQYPFLLYRDRSGESSLLVETLRACTLVSRAFARPAQIRLFSAVGLDQTRPKARAACTRFIELLRHRPHLCAYVRHLHLIYSPVNCNAELIFEILLLLSNLDAIKLQVRGSGSDWSAQPPRLRAALLVPLSRPSLRRVDLVQFTFANASELHALLKNAVGLKELELLGIQFHSNDSGMKLSPIAAQCTCPPTIFLGSLVLLGLGPADVESIMQAFTTVDITHLRSLKLIYTAPGNILRANALTIRKVEMLGGLDLPNELRDADIPPATARHLLNRSGRPQNIVC
ncbi:hypothetical protein B0H19DRAFT_1235742 [Mycena capillaripes]|nr:hypothetical protein B0H19DRAFT_1235742 [Mycena capillaripes]